MVTVEAPDGVGVGDGVVIDELLLPPHAAIKTARRAAALTRRFMSHFLL
jgi:hypothetical protein